MQVSKLASAIYNDVVSGLVGITSTPTMSISQLEDDVVDERLQIIKEYSLKDLIPKKDLLLAINCIDVDCKSLDRCCVTSNFSKPIAHFELPQIVNDFGDSAIDFVGSTDRLVSFTYYTNRNFKYHNLRLRGKNKPYVYIETTPNENNMYDAFIFNAPLLKRISVIGIFKDLRQVEDFSCCSDEMNNMTFIDAEIKKRLTEKKLRYYRQLYQQPQPNNQVPK
jgi:hypothetical protein